MEEGQGRLGLSFSVGGGKKFLEARVLAQTVSVYVRNVFLIQAK